MRRNRKAPVQLSSEEQGRREYRGMIISYLYTLARKRGISIKKISEEELQRVGARLVKSELDISSFDVEIPADPGTKAARLAFIKERLAENRRFMPSDPPPPSRRGRGHEGEEAEEMDEEEKNGFNNAEPMDEGLIGATSSSVGLKERF